MKVSHRSGVVTSSYVKDTLIVSLGHPSERLKLLLLKTV